MANESIPDIEWIDLTDEMPPLDKSPGYNVVTFGTGGLGPFVPLPKPTEKDDSPPCDSKYVTGYMKFPTKDKQDEFWEMLGGDAVAEHNGRVFEESLERKRNGLPPEPIGIKVIGEFKEIDGEIVYTPVDGSQE